MLGQGLLQYQILVFCLFTLDFIDYRLIAIFLAYAKAKIDAAVQEKWLLINIQSSEEFSSHMVFSFSFIVLP